MKSPMASHLAQEGMPKIVAAEYRLKSRIIDTIELTPAPAQHHAH